MPRLPRATIISLPVASLIATDPPTRRRSRAARRVVEATPRAGRAAIRSRLSSAPVTTVPLSFRNAHGVTATLSFRNAGGTTAIVSLSFRNARGGTDVPSSLSITLGFLFFFISFEHRYTRGLRRRGEDFAGSLTLIPRGGNTFGPREDFVFLFPFYF